MNSIMTTINFTLLSFKIVYYTILFRSRIRLNAIKPRTIISQVGLMNVNLLSPFRYFKMAAFIFLGNVFLYFLTLVAKGEKYTFVDQCDTGLILLDATDSHNSRISFTLNTVLRSDLLWLSLHSSSMALHNFFNNLFQQCLSSTEPCSYAVHFLSL